MNGSEQSATASEICDAESKSGPGSGKQRRKVITTRRLFEQIERQGFRCYFTGRELTPPTASIEHLQPLSRGGETELGNVVWVHKEINQAKGSLTAEEFTSLCREVVEAETAKTKQAAS